jgi:hypothetical protein
VHFEPGKFVIRASNERELTAEEITEACELLLTTACAYNCPFWLLDGRSHQREQPQELHDWMREEYFPRVRATLGQPPRVAFLVPPAIWAGLPDKGYDQPADWHSFAVRMAWFTDEESALAWLQHQARLTGAEVAF